MTKKQIIQTSEEAARLVAENRTGVAPRSKKHLERFNELKKAQGSKSDHSDAGRAAQN